MAAARPAASERRPGRARNLFAVRLWKEEADGGPEYRGSVRDVVTGAFRNFRDWSDLAAFMVARAEEDENARNPKENAMAMPIAAIDRQAVEMLRARFRGALLRPGEEGYDEARRIWNGAIDRRPALIARCAGADDVVDGRPLRAGARPARLGARRRARRRRPRRLRRRADDRPLADEGGPGRPGGADRPRRRRRSSGASSTAPPSRSGWPPPAASSATPASPA